MNQKQINRLEMFQATNTYMDDQPGVWSAIPILTTYKKDLSEVIDVIRASAKDQEQAQVFIGSSIRQLKRQIGDKMDILDDTLEAYADDTGDAELLSKASNSKSDYFRLPHEDFETKTINMINLLEDHAEAMKDYGITVDQIDDVKLSFGVFQDRRGKPRSYQIASSTATQDLEDMFKKGNDTVARLDRVMKRFKRSNTSFYNGYLAARTIIDD